jgi:hypothetical protein
MSVVGIYGKDNALELQSLHQNCKKVKNGVLFTFFPDCILVEEGNIEREWTFSLCELYLHNLFSRNIKTESSLYLFIDFTNIDVQQRNTIWDKLYSLDNLDFHLFYDGRQIPILLSHVIHACSKLNVDLYVATSDFRFAAKCNQIIFLDSHCIHTFCSTYPHYNYLLFDKRDAIFIDKEKQSIVPYIKSSQPLDPFTVFLTKEDKLGCRFVIHFPPV